MKNQKTTKVLDVNVEGFHFFCIFCVHQPRNQYHLYRRWYEDGSWHRKQLAAYGNFFSVICFLKDYMRIENIGFQDVFT